MNLSISFLFIYLNLTILLFTSCMTSSPIIKDDAQGYLSRKNIENITIFTFSDAWYKEQRLEEKSDTKNIETKDRQKERKTIAETAKGLLGTPYKYGGDNPQDGFDCSGLVKYVFAKHGKKLPHSARQQFQLSEKINPSKAKPGDLLFFNIDSNGISHVGIYIGKMQFIHAPKPKDKVRIANLNNNYWKKVFRGVRRVDL